MILLSGFGSTAARCSSVQSKIGPRMPEKTGAGIFSSSFIVGLFLQKAQHDSAMAMAPSSSAKVLANPVDAEDGVIRVGFKGANFGFDILLCLRAHSLDSVR